VLAYPASLPLPREYVSYLAGLIWRHRKVIGSRWRRLKPGRQALLTLVHLFKNEPFEQVAAAFKVGTSTAWRYVQEGVKLLAEQAPSLTEALWHAAWSGSNFVFVDGTVVPIDRVRGVPDPSDPADAGKGRVDRARAARARAEQQRRQRLKGEQTQPAQAPEPPWVPGSMPGSLPGPAPALAVVSGISPANLNRLYYSGKHKRHVVSLQALVDPYGKLAWISHGLPGSTQDLAAAAAHGLITLTRQAELYVVADLAYVGAGEHVLTGYRRTPGRDRTPGQKIANHALASLRARNEHGLAPLKRWRILHRARCCPRRIGTIAKAIHTLLTRVEVEAR
jgi:DDE superfamily endonuclease